MKGKECVTMLLAGGQGSRLGGLTRDVAKPAVAFGGKYRIIDFALSNCFYSGMDTVGVLTQYKPLLLNSYIGTGSSWALDAVNAGVTILPPYVTRAGGYWYKGTADAVYQNIEYIDFYDPEYVLIISGDQIYRMDYSKLIDFHKAKNADVTISVIEVPWEEAHRFGVLITDEQDQIVEFEEKPEKPSSNKASMGIYVFNWALLKDALLRDHFNENSANDFGKNIMPTLLNESKDMFAYCYEGYWRDVGTIDSYYEANMDLLEEKPPMNLYNEDFKINSNNLNVEPHFITCDGKVVNSLICDGSIIKGHISNSIIGNNVIIEKDAYIKDSIILNDCHIGTGAQLHKTIIGENVMISEHKKLGNDENNALEVVFKDI